MFKLLSSFSMQFVENMAKDMILNNIIRFRYDSDNIRLDDSLSEIEAKNRKIWADFVAGIKVTTFDIADQVDGVNELYINKQLRRAFGLKFDDNIAIPKKTMAELTASGAVNILERGNDLSESKELFFQSTDIKVKGLGADLMTRVELSTLEAVRQGKSPQQFTKDIQEITNYAKNRSAFIAVDQISKLNGNISKIRMKNNGLNTYVWETAGDNKVRPSHKIKDLTVRTWDQSPIPGEEPRCRCVATINLDELAELYPE